MLKVKDLKNLKKLGVFAGGVLFGTACGAVGDQGSAELRYLHQGRQVHGSRVGGGHHRL